MGQDTRLLGLLIMLAIRGHHSRLPHQAKLRDTLDCENLARQLANLHPEVMSCHPSLAGTLEEVDASSFEAIRDEARDLLDEALDHLESMPLRDRIVFRLAVQFCFSCLLEADKALLIHKDDTQYLGSAGMAIAPTVVEDHPPSGESSPHLDRQRGEALAAVIDDALESDVADLRPRLLTLPTGLGKTRCAAAWAFHLRDRIERLTGVRPKILIVLPYLSIIEQTARVYREELLEMVGKPNDETLAVSHSLSARDYGDLEEDEQDRAEFALDTWRSDIILTTFDQFLLALMDARTRHQQRFHNLCDAIIVIDEVQALPCCLWHPVGHVLRELARVGRSHVLLMTATQPGLLEPGDCAPLVRATSHFQQARYRLEYDPEEKHIADWLDELTEEIGKPENAAISKWLIVLNTRQAALDVYQHLRDAMPKEEVFVLSSSIVPRERLKRINDIRKTSRCIVASTQCVEAGVDLDMHRVIRDFGPLDSLVQVAGRCNRHGLRPRATVKVVRLRDDRQPYCNYIYDRILLDQTAVGLRGCPIDEENVLPIVEAYFARLHKYKDTGCQTTQRWSKFEHGRDDRRGLEELDVSRLLRGDQDQVSFVVAKLDPGLREKVEAAYGLIDRWERRRALRRLAPDIAQVTVSVWKSRKYTPSDIADPVPSGSPDPAFWFLHDDAYDRETGLCPPRALSSQIF
jgi:CRISPR-associated endonuclease/helicase Cas3